MTHFSITITVKILIIINLSILSCNQPSLSYGKNLDNLQFEFAFFGFVIINIYNMVMYADKNEGFNLVDPTYSLEICHN